MTDKVFGKKLRQPSRVQRCSCFDYQFQTDHEIPNFSDPSVLLFIQSNLVDNPLFSKPLAELDRLVKGNFICRYKREDGDLSDDAFGRKYDGPVVFKDENFSYRKLTSNICLPTIKKRITSIEIK